MEGNGAHGVLSRDDARPSIAHCSIRGNAGYGVLLKDGGGVLRDNTLSREPLAAPCSDGSSCGAGNPHLGAYIMQLLTLSAHPQRMQAHGMHSACSTDRN